MFSLLWDLCWRQKILHTIDLFFWKLRWQVALNQGSSVTVLPCNVPTLVNSVPSKATLSRPLTQLLIELGHSLSGCLFRKSLLKIPWWIKTCTGAFVFFPACHLLDGCVCSMGQWWPQWRANFIVHNHRLLSKMSPWPGTEHRNRPSQSAPASVLPPKELVIREHPQNGATCDQG